MGLCITAVQQVVDMIRMVGVIWWQAIEVLMNAGQLADVAKVVQVFIVLLYGTCCGEAWTGPVDLPDDVKM